ncbi:Arm DNA-binding domain-containing protein [Dechloromonas denitrificans]
MKNRFNCKEKRSALGIYPDASLKGAHERREEARKLLANDVINRGSNRH